MFIQFRLAFCMQMSFTKLNMFALGVLYNIDLQWHSRQLLSADHYSVIVSLHPIA